VTRRANRPRAYAPDPAAPGLPCEHPGCDQPGEYRAPRSRSALTDYRWLCLEHVREFNAAWDFYKGMSPGEIEAHRRADTSWQRPTWPLGRLGGALPEDAILDPLDVLGARGARRRAPAAIDTPSELRQPLDTFGLHWPVSLDEVKTRYKELAKRHHPDANGGSREAEERLKRINLAYAALRSHLTEPGFAPG
jgi:hypothetical protein